MEKGLREKLRSVLGDAPVASITPACALQSTNTAMPATSPLGPVPLTVPFEPNPVLGSVAVSVPAPSGEGSPELLAVASSQRANPLLDFRFFVLVAVTIICITIVLCLLIPRKEERDFGTGLQSEDDGYIEPARPQRTHRRPNVIDDEAEQLDTAVVDQRKQAPRGRPDARALDLLERANVPESVSARVTTHAMAPEQQSARPSVPSQSADPMFQPLRR